MVDRWLSQASGKYGGNLDCKSLNVFDVPDVPDFFARTCVGGHVDGSYEDTAPTHVRDDYLGHLGH